VRACSRRSEGEGGAERVRDLEVLILCMEEIIDSISITSIVIAIATAEL
jgi:hypothetical protein